MINKREKLREVVLVAGVRTPFGRANKGSFVSVRPDDLGAECLKALMNRVKIPNELIEDISIGCAMTEGEQGLNVARQIGFLAGFPASVAAQTVNRFCASALQAAISQAHAIACGEGDIRIAGGIESMTFIPMGGFNPMKAFNPKMIELNKGKPPAFTMPQTAQYVAEKYEISKESQDEFSYLSHLKATKAQDEGKFNDEIIPIEVEKDGQKITVSKDDCPRKDTSIQKIASLPPIVQNFDPNKQPMITAGNSCPTNDGATMVMLMDLDKAKELKIEPIAFVRATSVAGVEPYEMGIGPSKAIPKALDRAGLKLKDMDIIEINEAFASVVIANAKLLNFDWKDPRLNPNGGAVAIGHPLGASGARLLMTAAYELRRRNGRYAIVSLCIGGGQGCAMLIERA